MVKRHLKRSAMPNSWQIKRKGLTFVTRPKPGSHALKLGLPLNVILRDELKLGKTTKESKKILEGNEVLIDKVRRKDPHHIVGFMDTISIPAIKKYYRIGINAKGKLHVFAIDEKEANIKPCKIIGKSAVKGKMQLNLYDGKNVLVEKDTYKVGDSLIMDVAQKKIADHVKLGTGSQILLIGGKSIGHVGQISKIEGDKVFYKSKRGVFETLKKYAYVIGKDKSAIALQND